MRPILEVLDLGCLAYGPARDAQLRRVDEVLAARERGVPVAGFILLVEHDAVVTISRRPGAASHLLASPDDLRRAGVAVEETDRGGDITYHGPGQLVAYPILDLNLLNLGIHDYMRLLEGAIIAACAGFGVAARRDPPATGVWVDRPGGPAKIAALGVRVRRWVSSHGLALNVTTDLSHFDLIVPCGQPRPVTSLDSELGDRCPPMSAVKDALAGELRAAISVAAETAAGKRAAARGSSTRSVGDAG